MVLSASQWLTALLTVQLKADDSIDTTALASDLSKLKGGLTGYKKGISRGDSSSLPLGGQTTSEAIDAIIALDEILQSTTGFVEVFEKPDSLTAQGTKGEYYIDRDYSLILPPDGPTVNAIYICLNSQSWIKLLLVP